MIESPVLKLKRQKGPNLYLLTRAKTIQEEDIQVHAKWAIVKKWYDDTRNHPDVEWVDKAMTTVLNSIIHQNRVVFAVTLDKTRELLRNDKNWWVNNREGTGIGLKDTNYSLLFNKLIEAGVIEQVREQKHKEPRVFRVCNSDFIDMLEINISAEDQEREVLDFIDSPKGSAKGSTEGSAKGNTEMEKYRNGEMEKTNPIQTEQKINFEQLLVRQYSDDFPRLEDISYLAELAIENCCDFEVDKFTLRTFRRHLENTCKGNITPKQKKFMDKLVTQFERDATKAYNLRASHNLELRQPTKINVTSLSPEKESEDQIQNNTVNAAKNFCNAETINVLKYKIKHEENPRIKSQLEWELNYWEKISNG